MYPLLTNCTRLVDYSHTYSSKQQNNTHASHNANNAVYPNRKGLNQTVRITITKYNKEEYRATLLESLDRFIAYAGHTDVFEYRQYLPLAEHLKAHIDDVAVHIHNFCFNSDNTGKEVYPRELLRSLYDYRYFCYKNRVDNPDENFCTLEEQNEYSRNYVHFDFSVKSNLKAFRDL